MDTPHLAVPLQELSWGERSSSFRDVPYRFVYRAEHRTIASVQEQGTVQASDGDCPLGGKFLGFAKARYFRVATHMFNFFKTPKTVDLGVFSSQTPGRGLAVKSDQLGFGCSE